MKLHLPCKLFTAVLACLFAAASPTFGGETTDYVVDTTVTYGPGTAIASDETTGILLRGGTLELALAEDGTVAKPISGEGALVKKVNNTATLTNLSATISSIAIEEGALELNLTEAYTLDSAFSGNGTFIKSGSNTITRDAAYSHTGFTSVRGGQLTFTGDLQGYGGMEVTGKSTLYINAGKNGSTALNTGDVSVGPGSTLKLHHGAGTFNAKDENGNVRKANLTLTAATFESEDMEGKQNWGKLTLGTDEENANNRKSYLKYGWKGQMEFETLSGDGDLEINIYNKDSNTTKTTFKQVTNFDGTITQTGNLTFDDGSRRGFLYINGVDQGKGFDLKVEGDSFSTGDFVKSGEGTATFAGSHTFGGNVTVTGGKLDITGNATGITNLNVEKSASFSAGSISLSSSGAVNIRKDAKLAIGSGEYGNTFDIEGGTLDLGSSTLGEDSIINLLLLGTPRENSSTLYQRTTHYITGDKATLKGTIQTTGKNEADLFLSGKLNVEGALTYDGELQLVSGDINITGNSKISNHGIICVSDANVIVDGNASLANTGGDIKVQSGSLTLKKGAIVDCTNSSGKSDPINVTGGVLTTESGSRVNSFICVIGEGGVANVQAGSVVKNGIYAYPTSGSASLGAASKKSGGDDGTTFKDVKVTSYGFSSIDGKAGSINNAMISVLDYNTILDVDEAIICDMTLNNSTVDIYIGTLFMDNTVMNNTVVNVNANTSLNGSEGKGSVLNGVNITLQYKDNYGLVASTDQSEVYNNRSYTIVQTDQLKGMYLGDGSSLTLNLSKDISSGLVDGQSIALRFNGLCMDTDAHDLSSNDYFKLSTGMSPHQILGVDYAEDSTTIYITSANSQAVPEPATATLSLLALAAIAARRRRK